MSNYIKDLLNYDPTTGIFKWKVNRGGKAIAGTHFDTPEEVAIAYNEAAEKLHGKFARKNMVEQ